MKFQYYVNLSDLPIRADDSIMVDFQGKKFKSIQVISSVIQANVNLPNPVLKLKTFSGNGLTTDRKSLAMCIYDKISNVGSTDRRYSTTTGVLYHLPVESTSVELSVDALSGASLNPYSLFDSMAVIFEIEESENSV